MNTWKVIFAAMVIFATGVVTGGLLINHVDRLNNKKQSRRESAAPLPSYQVPGRDAARKPAQELPVLLEQRRIEFVLSAARELKLSEDQRQRIEKIVRESQEQAQKLWEQVGPQMRKELHESRERIRTELTPEQLKRFEELLQNRQRRSPDQPATGPRNWERPNQPAQGNRPFPDRPRPPRDGAPSATNAVPPRAP